MKTNAHSSHPPKESSKPSLYGKKAMELTAEAYTKSKRTLERLIEKRKFITAIAKNVRIGNEA